MVAAVAAEMAGVGDGQSGMWLPTFLCLVFTFLSRRMEATALVEVSCLDPFLPHCIPDHGVTNMHYSWQAVGVGMEVAVAVAVVAVAAVMEDQEVADQEGTARCGRLRREERMRKTRKILGAYPLHTASLLLSGGPIDDRGRMHIIHF